MPKQHVIKKIKDSLYLFYILIFICILVVIKNIIGYVFFMCSFDLWIVLKLFLFFIPWVFIEILIEIFILDKVKEPHLDDVISFVYLTISFFFIWYFFEHEGIYKSIHEALKYTGILSIVRLINGRKQKTPYSDTKCGKILLFYMVISIIAAFVTS